MRFTVTELLTLPSSRCSGRVQVRFGVRVRGSWFLVPSRAESSSIGLLDLLDFLPLHPGGGEDDALRQAVASANLDVCGREVQDLDHHFVCRPRVVGVDDADAVGDLETALERGAASGENRQAMSGWNLDNESS